MTDWSLWTYRARPDPMSDHEHGVVDGDTLDLLLDLGMATHQRVRVRLDGVDTAEKYGTPHISEEYQKAIEHTGYVEDWIATALIDAGPWPLVVQTRKDDTGKYGRLLATVSHTATDESLNEAVRNVYPEVVA